MTPTALCQSQIANRSDLGDCGASYIPAPSLMNPRSREQRQISPKEVPGAGCIKMLLIVIVSLGDHVTAHRSCLSDGAEFRQRAPLPAFGEKPELRSLLVTR